MLKSPSILIAMATAIGVTSINTFSASASTSMDGESPPSKPDLLEFEVSGNLGDNVFGLFEELNSGSFQGSYSYFSDAPDLDPVEDQGKFPLSNFQFTLFDRNDNPFGSVALDDMAGGFLVWFNPIGPIGVPATFVRSSSTLSLARSISPDPVTSSLAPQKVSFELFFQDDHLRDEDIVPTAGPTGGFLNGMFQFWVDPEEGSCPESTTFSNQTGLCLLDQVTVADATLTEPSGAQPVPESSTTVGLFSILGLGWLLKKRR